MVELALTRARSAPGMARDWLAASFEGRLERDFDLVGGWGLSIVDAVASRWGIHEGTTHVWFELERPGPRLGPDSKPTF